MDLDIEIESHTDIIIKTSLSTHIYNTTGKIYIHKMD